MDLLDLRCFIVSQKARLEQERNALMSQRSLVNAGTSEAILLSRPQSTNLSSKDDSFALEVSDALNHRINDLNSVKNEFTQVKENDECKIVSENTLISKNQDVLIDDPGAGDKSRYPESLPVQHQITTSTSPTVHFVCDIEKKQDASFDITPKEPKIKQSQSGAASLVSRDGEIEKLQEKFSSAPFWDNFGRSATSKKWSSNAQSTMVRVGEFSPANPDLQAPGKTLLGLGEYEERRRQLLEKKKLEYKEYLSQTRNSLHRTDHIHHPVVKSNYEVLRNLDGSDQEVSNFGHGNDSVDASTQTDKWFIEQSQADFGGNTAVAAHSVQATEAIGEPFIQLLSPRVPRAHSSGTTEQLPNARLRQLQLQEELRLQIEEKRRLEAERREQERLEEEALQRRVAEQQAHLQAEYERDEKLRREREIQKQQQIEEFQRRQEELKAEAEALKLEERRQKLEAAPAHHNPSDPLKGPVNAHLVPPSEPAPLSILKSASPPLRSPRRVARGSGFSDDFSHAGPPSPRALIKVLEGPSLPKQSTRLEDSLPIPLMSVAHSHAPSSPTHQSPRRSPHVSPHRSPSRFVSYQDCHIAPAAPLYRRHHCPHPQARAPSEAMRHLEERWKVPAVQKNVCVRGKQNVHDSNTGNVLTQLGAFRRQLQMEHMRMEEKVRERHQPHQYQQQYYQQHVPQRGHHS